MKQPEEIPFSADAGDPETVAREIIEAARDVVDQPGTHAVITVYFKRHSDAQKVVDCLNNRYLSAQSHRIEINLYN